MTTEPWTRAKLLREMNKAGWKNNGQPGWYRHEETGQLIDVDKYEPEHGCTVGWYWRKRREVPPVDGDE